MADFTEKLQDLGQGKTQKAAALTFLSDLSTEDRTTFRRMWPQFPLERRRKIIAAMADLVEDDIELYFRPVFLVALEDTDPQVRLSSIEGLFEDDSKLLLGKLLGILTDDPDDDVRAAAAKALSRFTYKAQCAKLGDEAPRLRQTLLDVARDLDEDDEVRRRAVESLGYLSGDSEVQDVIEKAYERGGREAESAVYAMGRSIDERWQQTVLSELESDQPAMRYEAARAAGEMALEDALSYLVRMIDDRDLEVKLATVWALGQIGGKPAAEALTRAMKSNEPALREAAEEALQEIVFSTNPMNVL